jgi:hypothetical protein
MAAARLFDGDQPDMVGPVKSRFGIMFSWVVEETGDGRREALRR